jgi:O-antigen/teichoic acid export membrane protein
VSVLWTLLNALGIGMFLPVEQEVGRVTAVLRTRGGRNGTYTRAVVVVTLALLAGFTALAVVTGSLLSERLFTGHGSLVLMLVLAMAGMALSYLVRGLLSGQGRFGHYGAQLAVDGVLRVAAAALLYATGVQSVAAYAAILFAAPTLAVLVTTPRPSSLVHRGGSTVDGRTVFRSVGTLLAASVLSQVLANAGLLVVQLLAGPDEAEASGNFLSGLVIARVPLFFFAAVQAVFLPALATLAGSGDFRAFGARVRLVGAGTLVIGAAGVLGIWLLGTQVVPLLFGPEFVIDRGVITLVAVSGALFMLAQVAAQGLLALGRDRAVVVGWAIGLLALVLAVMLPGDAVHRAAWSLVVGSAAALVPLAVLLQVRQVRWRRGGTVDVPAARL